MVDDVYKHRSMSLTMLFHGTSSRLAWTSIDVVDDVVPVLRDWVRGIAGEGGARPRAGTGGGATSIDVVYDVIPWRITTACLV